MAVKLSVVGLGKLSVVKECTCVRQMWPSTDNRGLLILETYVSVCCIVKGISGICHLVRSVSASGRECLLCCQLCSCQY